MTVTNEDGAEVFKLENVAPDKINIPDIPKGQYTMTVTWVDGVENTLTFPITISDDNSSFFGRSDLKADYTPTGDVEDLAPFIPSMNETSGQRLMIAKGYDGTSASNAVIPDSFGAQTLCASYEAPFGILLPDPDRFLLSVGKSSRGYMRI